MRTEIVSLKRGPYGGLDVPLDAYTLMFELKSRDLDLTQQGDMLKIRAKDGSRPVFSDEERTNITKWKAHILAMLAYVPPEV